MPSPVSGSVSTQSLPSLPWLLPSALCGLPRGSSHLGSSKTSINSSILPLSHGQGSPPIRVKCRVMNSTSLTAQEIPAHVPWFAHVGSIAQTLLHILAHAAPRETERNFPPLLSGVSHSNVRAWLPDSFQLEAELSAQCHLTLLGAVAGKQSRERQLLNHPDSDGWCCLDKKHPEEYTQHDV